MPDETASWLDGEVERLRLTVRDDDGSFAGRRFFVWPSDETWPVFVRPGEAPEDGAGVLVDFAVVRGDTLTMGDTGWKASAFSEPTASVGRRLSQQLSRSLRKLATVPLYACAPDRSIAEAPAFAWGSPAAIESGLVLRQFLNGTVTFVPK